MTRRAQDRDAVGWTHSRDWARAGWRNHRREIAVLFADLRGWTAFSATTEPGELTLKGFVKPMSAFSIVGVRAGQPAE